ncbi:MAG: D-alanyl-D-alanine carboxypeptidase precursor [Bacteroidetes bacterium ADurb.Bin408]|nr:MAG: D-alanyl-D-alanine carboxypeptidase precursor [Bacteroidetes bacterium ADurb.Bin408]
MKRILILAFVMGVLFSCKKAGVVPTVNIECNPVYNSAAHPKNAVFSAVVNKYMALGLPGMSVLIEDSNGIWVGSAGYADIKNNIPFTPCHISKGGSITKIFMGALFFKLQEEGKISLEDPVSKYIDNSILSKIKYSGEMKVRNLLNHTTGIFDLITSSDFYLAVINNPNKQWEADELLKYVYGIEPYPLNQPYPARYSSTNTLLLAMCIEKATGQKHYNLLREKILNPLGLDNTYYQGRETIPSHAAQGYYDLHNNHTIVNVSNLITGSGNGYTGIFSNVYDYHRFIKALFVDKTVLSQASLDTMLTFVQEDDDYWTGFGAVKKFVDKPAYGIGHTGRDLGYVADLFYFPQRGIIMAFCVNYGTDGDSFLKPVFLDFEQELVDKILE